ncbi:MAG: Holliday junction resolvase RuvX [Bacteroidaceae bacterium]|nr:Holliday junction resolvase RuvX [Bacteroidaceae bacterium]
MARILSIDYGKKRTGIAVTDPMQMIANPLTTVDTTTLFDFIKQYMESEEVERIIVGKPLQTNGEASENMKRVEPFVNRLKKLYPTIPIEYYDERFTSVLAHKAMIDSGISKKARQDKALVDKISASIILEDYLESRRNQAERDNK